MFGRILHVLCFVAGLLGEVPLLQEDQEEPEQWWVFDTLAKKTLVNRLLPGTSLIALHIHS